MIQTLDNHNQDIVAIKIKGQIDSEDYNKILPLIEKQMQREGGFKLYCELDDIEGLEPAAVWKDLRFDVKHHDDVDRLAIVGEKRWMDWMSKLAKPFTSTEVMYYEKENKEEAMHWIMQE